MRGSILLFIGIRPEIFSPLAMSPLVRQIVTKRFQDWVMEIQEWSLSSSPEHERQTRRSNRLTLATKTRPLTRLQGQVWWQAMEPKHRATKVIRCWPPTSRMLVSLELTHIVHALNWCRAASGRRTIGWQFGNGNAHWSHVIRMLDGAFPLQSTLFRACRLSLPPRQVFGVLRVPGFFVAEPVVNHDFWVGRL